MRRQVRRATPSSASAGPVSVAGAKNRLHPGLYPVRERRVFRIRFGSRGRRPRASRTTAGRRNDAAHGRRGGARPASLLRLRCVTMRPRGVVGEAGSFVAAEPASRNQALSVAEPPMRRRDRIQPLVERSGTRGGPARESPMPAVRHDAAPGASWGRPGRSSPRNPHRETRPSRSRNHQCDGETGFSPWWSEAEPGGPARESPTPAVRHDAAPRGRGGGRSFVAAEPASRNLALSVAEPPMRRRDRNQGARPANPLRLRCAFDDLDDLALSGRGRAGRSGRSSRGSRG